MSEEKKELKKNLKNEELCEGKQKLSIEELENVNGGGNEPCLDGVWEELENVNGGGSEPDHRRDIASFINIM